MAEPESTWRDVRGAGGSLVLPQLAMRRGRSMVDRVLAARVVWTAFVVLHVWLGVAMTVVLIVNASDGAVSVPVAGGGVLLVGGGASLARYRTARQALDDSDAQALADSWYVRFLRQSAMAALILPWTLLAGVISGGVAPFLVGLVLAAVNLWLLAPTDDRLAAEAAAVQAEGCTIDLVSALRSGGGRAGPAGRTRRKG